MPETLFGQLADMAAPPPQLSSGDAASIGFGRGDAGRAPPPRSPYCYPMRPGLPGTEATADGQRMPRDMHVLVESLVDSVTFTAEHRAMVRQLRTDVERRETDLFDAAATRRVAEQAVISELFAQENAFRALRVSDYIGIQDLARRLLEAAPRYRAGW